MLRPYYNKPRRCTEVDSQEAVGELRVVRKQGQADPLQGSVHAQRPDARRTRVRGSFLIMTGRRKAQPARVLFVVRAGRDEERVHPAQSRLLLRALLRQPGGLPAGVPGAARPEGQLHEQQLGHDGRGDADHGLQAVGLRQLGTDQGVPRLQLLALHAQGDRRPLRTVLPALK